MSSKLFIAGEEVVINSDGYTWSTKPKPNFLKFPKNYHMQWLREHISSKEIRINFHYGDKKYLADFISVENSQQWSSKKPVIISVQTGKGKNYFMLYKLLKKLIEQFPDEKNHILFLSNRVAINRQSKIQVAEFLVALIPTDEYKRKIKEIYTSEGIDEYCVDFEKITICTYHQMYERKLLNEKQFRYIICDECHFFTSDSTFNPETNNILKEIVNQGKNSIRIYMSATIEVVSEAIVREEISIMENKRNSIITKMRDENIKHAKEVYKDTDFSNPNTYGAHILTMSNNDIHRYHHKQNLYERQYGIRYPYSEEEIKKIYDSYFLEIDFYYMPRNYDYLEKIIPYETNDELIEHIKQSKEKWIIFVHSENEGKRLENELTKKGIVNSDDCIFISRPLINLEDTKTVEYDFIIANENTRKRVLITTCVLDNGINIKNQENDKPKNKILNIAIDSYDRTQFIQMLGRVRDNKKDKLKLYIKEHSLEDLKKYISRDSEGLIKRLINPLLPKKEKQRNFDKNLFYFTENPNVFSTYNPCAIYQLIDQITRTLRIIRNFDEKFFIKVNDNLNILKEKIYHSYMNIPPDTPEIKHIRESWEKSIIDLLETPVHHETIESCIKTDMEKGIDPTPYYSTLNDTFTKFLFSDMIPEYLFSIIENRYSNYLERLNSANLNYHNGMVKRKLGEEPNKSKSSYYSQIIYLYNKCKILKELFPDEYQDLSIDFVKDYAEKIKHYEDLADDDNFTSFLDEQLRWIEKYPNDLSTETIEVIDSDQPINEFIKSHAITTKDLENNIRKKSDGTNANYINGNFLNQYGILKDSDKAKELSTTYFNDSELSKCINKKITIENITYTLTSKNSNEQNHKTYYLFIKPE